jgi:hypothetical protein
MIIKIFGGKAEGKSTISEWLVRELTKLGIQVETSDETDGEMPLLAERLKVLGNPHEPLKIEIKTIPYGAETRPQYARDFAP